MLVHAGKKKWQLDRRSFLRSTLSGVGTLIGLPLLEAMIPPLKNAHAQDPRDGNLFILYWPNGVDMDLFEPSAGPLTGALPQIPSPLNNHRGDLFFPLGLFNPRANAGGSAHHRAISALLTGNPSQINPSSLRVGGPSFDHVLAAQLPTQAAPLNLSVTNRPKPDVGWNGRYAYSLSWRTSTAPITNIENPQQAFQDLFGSGGGGNTRHGNERAREARQTVSNSVLDDVRDSIRRLNNQLGARDRETLDSHLTLIEDLQNELERTNNNGGGNSNNGGNGRSCTNETVNNPGDYMQRFRQLSKVAQLAMLCQVRQVVTLMMGSEIQGDEGILSSLGLDEGSTTYHWHMHRNQTPFLPILNGVFTEFSRTLTEMKNRPFGNGTLLDNTGTVMTCSYGEAGSHDYRRTATILAGGRNMGWRTGRAVEYGGSNSKNFLNLMVGIAQTMNVSMNSFANSNGVIRPDR